MKRVSWVWFFCHGVGLIVCLIWTKAMNDSTHLPHWSGHWLIDSWYIIPVIGVLLGSGLLSAVFFWYLKKQLGLGNTDDNVETQAQAEATDEESVSETHANSTC